MPSPAGCGRRLFSGLRATGLDGRSSRSALGLAGRERGASPAGAFITGKVLEVDGGIQEPNLDLKLPDLA